MLSAFHGLCMALADSVPGVSGGTIAFILGFYDDLLRTLHGLFGRDRSVRQQSLRALLRFGAGWAAGMIACILVLAELFELHIYFMCSLFLGLSAAAFPLVLRAERSALRNAARCAPLALLGAALTVGLTLLRADTAVSLRVEFSQIRVWPLLYLFISGAAAVSAKASPANTKSSFFIPFPVDRLVGKGFGPHAGGRPDFTLRKIAIIRETAALMTKKGGELFSVRLLFVIFPRLFYPFEKSLLAVGVLEHGHEIAGVGPVRQIGRAHV